MNENNETGQDEYLLDGVHAKGPQAACEHLMAHVVVLYLVRTRTVSQTSPFSCQPAFESPYAFPSSFLPSSLYLY
jgi:hypothetical protein